MNLTSIGRRPLGAVLVAAAWTAAAQPYVRDEPVPANFFGLVIHRAHTTTAWPNVAFGSWRLWDSYLKWSDIQPVPGAFKFEAFDRQVELGERNGKRVYYTLGQTPAWASIAGGERHAWGLGAGAMPKDLEDWRQYVEAVSSRYKGRIEAYEIWNEPKYADAMGRCRGAIFFCGTPADLLKLTQSAAEIVKRNDPKALIATPGFTSGLVGVKALDDYLSTGAGKYIDVVSFHFYELHPEVAWKTITELRKVMNTHRLGSKPIWNTEVGYLIQNQEGGNKPLHEVGPFSMVFTPEAASARMVRVHLVAAAGGVDRVTWYAWDSKNMGLIGSLDGKPNAAGRAYPILYSWLLGVSLSCGPDSGFGQWRCDLRRGGRKAAVYWDNEVHERRSATAPGRGTRSMETLQGVTRAVEGGTVVDWDGSPVLFTEDGRPWS